MDENGITKSLAGSGIPAVKFFSEVGSTNDIAMEWASQGAQEFSLVVADAQTSGRGRLQRKWVTKAGEGLAFSLVLRPKPNEQISLFSALGGIAVCEAMIRTFHLSALIKWPNDVLIEGKKFCGILAESKWEESATVVLGIGINIGRGSLPTTLSIKFPGTTLETEMGQRPDRTGVLTNVVKELFHWRDLLGTAEFISYWNQHLAFRGEPVKIAMVDTNVDGILTGINEKGNLQIHMENGKTINVEMGDVQLRPMSDPKEKRRR